MIENEKKYIMDLSITNLTDRMYQFSCIKQFYYGENRYRCETFYSDNIQVGEPEYTITIKTPAIGSLGNQEVILPVDSTDYHHIYNSNNVKTISKYRFRFKSELVWEIDLFYGSGLLLLSMMEVEMPENMEEPEIVPEILKDYIVYSVPRIEDHLFSNYRLTDSTYLNFLRKMLYAKK